mgnify:CR=1 FL=1
MDFTGETIEPKAFKAMLDKGALVHVLDTRNDYELRLGTFDNAIDLNLETFRAFPEAIQNLPESMKDEPVVMFCTGGIRCEKASAIMVEAGFRNVKQLKGGILGGILRRLEASTGTVIASCSTSGWRSMLPSKKPTLWSVSHAVNR